MVKFPATVKSQQEALKMYLTYSWTQITDAGISHTPTFCSLPQGLDEDSVEHTQG